MNINTLLFKLQSEALFPLVYFKFNFYVRNSTWNADTGEYQCENTHMTHDQTLPLHRKTLRFLRQTHFSNSWEMRVLTRILQATGYNTDSRTHLRQQRRADPSSAEVLERTSLTVNGVPLLLWDQATFSSSFQVRVIAGRCNCE